MRERLTILLTNIEYSFLHETAHWANNWGNIISTCFYTISQIIFIEVLYSNVNSIAGYSRDQLLLFMLVGQAGYYLTWTIHYNLEDLITSVNRGVLDTLLIKPVPSLFYITFKKVKIFSILRDCIPPTLILVSIINWGNLIFTPTNLLIGIAIMIMGTITMHVIHLLSTIPVFWLGESSSILSLTDSAEYNIGKVVPYEGFSNNLKVVFTTIFPALISAGIATSVILGKINPTTYFFGTLAIMALALFIRTYAWNKAIKIYTSASS